MELSQALTEKIFAFMLVFARFGTAFMLLPGFGDPYVSPRIRLLLALAITALVVPVLGPKLPAAPSSAVDLFLLMAMETFVGVFLGTITRMLMSALETAGTIVSLQTGLSAAQMFNPALASQGSLIGAMLGYLGLLLIFVTDLHHLLILAVVESYDLFVPGQPLPFGDFAETVTRLVADSFQIGAQMAAPFLVFGLTFNIALGILSKMMPQLQVFFLAQSAQIAAGLFMLAFVLSAAMMYWLRGLENALMGFLGST